MIIVNKVALSFSNKRFPKVFEMKYEFQAKTMRNKICKPSQNNSYELVSQGRHLKYQIFISRITFDV